MSEPREVWCLWLSAQSARPLSITSMTITFATCMLRLSSHFYKHCLIDPLHSPTGWAGRYRSNIIVIFRGET